jgi:ABC-2 type transport system permease protein
MRVYWELARVGFRRYATYRGATIAGVFTNCVFGFMLAYIQIALFNARPHINGWDQRDALTYVWLAQGMLATIYIWGWTELGQRVRTGDIATDLQRPVGFVRYWLAQDMGRAIYHALSRGIPPFLLGALIFQLRLPEHPLTWVWFVVSIVLAVAISFGLRFLVNIAAVWIFDYRGIMSITAFAWPFLAGMEFPLILLPGWALSVALVLPFAGMIQSPVAVFLEKPATVQTIGLQALWAVAILLLSRVVMNAAERRLVVQGG